MIREFTSALVACVVTFALCALVYPALVYGLGHTLFPAQAEGSLIERDGKVIGSSLIAQPFHSARYFTPRPSAAGSTGYAADAASGSNLATGNPALQERIMLTTAQLLAESHADAALQADLDRCGAIQTELTTRKAASDPSSGDRAAIDQLEKDRVTALSSLLGRLNGYRDKPEDLVATDQVTASGSGLDPDISPESASFQASRVAKARQVPVAQIQARIDARTDRSGALFGGPARVNVLLLNLDLDLDR